MKRELYCCDEERIITKKKQEQFSDPTANVASFIQKLDISFGRNLILLIDESNVRPSQKPIKKILATQKWLLGLLRCSCLGLLAYLPRGWLTPSVGKSKKRQKDKNIIIHS